MPRKRAPTVRFCELCGAYFGAERGPASKTCSIECQRDRNNAKEKKRYQKVKNTKEWQETRADYLERIKQRLKTDSAYAERFYAARRAAENKYRTEIAKDPQRWAEYQAKHRAWFHNATPEQRENMRAKNRAWYASLDSQSKQIFLLQLRLKRAEQRINSLNKESNNENNSL